MRAVCLCISKNGILYLDGQLECWVFELKNGQFLPLKKGESREFYETHGFYEISVEKLKVLLSCYEDIIDRSKVPNDITIIDDVQEGMVFKDEYAPWCYRVIFHPMLAWCSEKWDINVINYIDYCDGDMMLCTDDQINYELEDLTPFSDAEIDAMKVGELPDDWFLDPPNGQVLCYNHADKKNYMYFMSGFNKETNEFLAVGYEEDDGFDYARPLTNDELESYKSGL